MQKLETSSIVHGAWAGVDSSLFSEEKRGKKLKKTSTFKKLKARTV